MAGKAEQAVRTLNIGEECNLAELPDWMTEAGYGFGVEVYLQSEAARWRFVEQRCADVSKDWKIHLFFETDGTLARFKDLYAEDWTNTFPALVDGVAAYMGAACGLRRGCGFRMSIFEPSRRMKRRYSRGSGEAVEPGLRTRKAVPAQASPRAQKP